MLNFDRNIVFIVLIVLLGASLMVILPFISSLFWAGLLAFATWPLMTWLTRMLGGRVTLAASILTASWILLVALPVLALGFNMAEHFKSGTDLIRVIWVNGLPPAPTETLMKIPFVGDYLIDGWHRLEQESTAISSSIRPHLAQIGHGAGLMGAKLGGGMLELSLSLVLVFFFYRDGPSIAAFTKTMLERLIDVRASHYMDLISGTVQRVINGVIGTALAQGLLAFIGLWIAGIPGAGALGVLTFFLSLIPAGPVLVWLPAAAWLMFNDSYGYATFMALWGFVIVSGVDNVLKPYLISRGGSLPLLIVLAGVLGGMAAWGLLGVVLGPTLLAVTYSLLKDWAGDESNAS